MAKYSAPHDDEAHGAVGEKHGSARTGTREPQLEYTKNLHSTRGHDNVALLVVGLVL